MKMKEQRKTRIAIRPVIIGELAWDGMDCGAQSATLRFDNYGRAWALCGENSLVPALKDGIHLTIPGYDGLCCTYDIRTGNLKEFYKIE